MTPAAGSEASAEREAMGAELRARNNRGGDCSSLGAHRSAFTLVELLVSILIIAILAGLFLGALSRAQTQANIAHTQALITKLNTQLMLRYESYRTRRLPIDTTSLIVAVNAYNANNPTTPILLQQAMATYRLNALRELMRMELPDRYSDLMAIPDSNYPSLTYPNLPNNFGLPTSAPAVPGSIAYNGNQLATGQVNGSPVYINPTATNLSYQRRVNANASAPTAAFEDAECLYLIITGGLADNTMAGEQISPNDIGDTDGDGMPEFHDAWGNPIRFLRWAPGFVSDLQPYDPLNSPQDPRFTAKNHDPLDPLKMQHPFNPSARTAADCQLTQQWPNASLENYNNGMMLYPLIYSAGPDRSADIQRPPTIANFSPPPHYAQPSRFANCHIGRYYGNTPVQFHPMTSPLYDPYSAHDPATTNSIFNTNASKLVGEPSDIESTGMILQPDGELSNGDNITNHLTGQ